MTVTVDAYSVGYVDRAYSADYYSTLIDHLNVKTKRIHIRSGVRGYHAADELYPEVRNILARDITIQQMAHPMGKQGGSPTGLDAFGNETFTPVRAVFNDGWRVVLPDESHEFFISGEQITDDGAKGSGCLDMTLFSEGVNVAVNYEPTASERVSIETGSNTNPWEIAKPAIPTPGTWGHFVGTRLLTLLNFLGYK